MRVLVIGRGIAGLTTAYHLLRRPCDVVVAGLPSGPTNASAAAYGVCAVKGLKEARQRTFAAKIAGLRRLPSFLEALQPHAEQNLYMAKLWEPFFSTSDLQKTQQRIYKREFRGLYRMHYHGDCSYLPPLLQNWPQLVSANEYPEDLWLNAAEVLRALEVFLKVSGTCSFYDAMLESIEPEGGQRWVAKLDGTPHIFDEVIYCGGWSGINLLQTALQTELDMRAAPGSLFRATHHSPTKAVALTKGQNFLTLTGGTAFFSASSADSPLQSLDKTFPAALSHLRLGSSWQEMKATRAYLPNRIPLVGSLRRRDGQHRLWVSTAYHKIGFMVAELLAERLVEQMFAASPVQERQLLL